MSLLTSWLARPHMNARRGSPRCLISARRPSPKSHRSRWLSPRRWLWGAVISRGLVRGFISPTTKRSPQADLELCEHYRDEAMLSPTRDAFDRVLAPPKDDQLDYDVTKNPDRFDK